MRAYRKLKKKWFYVNCYKHGSDAKLFVGRRFLRKIKQSECDDDDDDDDDDDERDPGLEI